MTELSRASAPPAREMLRNLIVTVALTAITALTTQAQTYRILHQFTGGADGSLPYAALSIDRGGNLYGTTATGGSGYGTVYQLAHHGSGWTLRTLYKFAGGHDGAGPLSRPVIGPDGTLFGTTNGGGAGCPAPGGCGTVYHLRPPAAICRAVSCAWTEEVLWSFSGGSDGGGPMFGDLLIDRAGTLYGTTLYGGSNGCGSGCGTVFTLSPSAGGWTYSVAYAFTGASGDGASSYAGVIQDAAGNLYGTTEQGGPANNGTVYRLSRTQSGWTETILYGFQGPSDGRAAVGGLIFDPSGNVIGTTASGGTNGGGTAFALTPQGSETVLFNFTGMQEGGPWSGLTMDAAGNLYGTTYDDGAHNNGAVFKLTPSAGGWTYTELYSFMGGSDGRCPYGGVVIDAQGNLYGTAEGGGQYGEGIVWEITP